MARIPLFFQHTFATQLFGALHDPEAEAAVEKSKASSLLRLSNILSGAGSLGGFGAAALDDGVGVRVGGLSGNYGGGFEGGGPVDTKGDETPNKGLGSSEANKPSTAKRYKVGK